MSARLVADASALREALARAYDPAAFEDHPIEKRRHAAAIQWAARRHLATEAADRVLASGVVQPREDAVREAFSAAADDWQQGEWADAPRRSDRIAERMANAQHVTDWLRNRAALVPGHDHEGGK